MTLYAIILTMLLNVPAPSRTITESEIKGVIEKFINAKREASAGEKDEFSLEYRSVPSEISHVSEEAIMRVVDDGTISLRNNVLLPMEVLVDGRVAHSFFVTIKIRRFGTVLIASNRIEKKQQADSVLTRREKVETTLLPHDIINDGARLAGKRAKRIINAGMVLTESMFESIPTITQGTSVTLSVKSNNVAIEVQAVAQEDGATGEIIAVQRVGSGKRFKARVLDEQTVELVSQN